MAESIQRFIGEAREKDQLVYLEKHTVLYDHKKRVLESSTDYVKPDGKVFARLHTDYRGSISLPTHTFEDLRTGSVYGLRHEKDKVKLFRREKGKEEKAKYFHVQDGGRIEMASQGFNYYLKGKTAELRDKKKVPVSFFVPGALKTYNFLLSYDKENNDQTVDYQVKIENLFLRLFAPRLEFRYDEKAGRIAWYKGISAVKGDDRKLMNVTVTYKDE